MSTYYREISSINFTNNVDDNAREKQALLMLVRALLFDISEVIKY